MCDSGHARIISMAQSASHKLACWLIIPLMELKDKVALVTGGTKGIGAAAAIALAEAGAHCSLVARNLDEEAKETQRKIQALGRKCLLISGDMGKAEEAAGCVAQTTTLLGAPDVVIHSAGGPVNGGL